MKQAEALGMRKVEKRNTSLYNCLPTRGGLLWASNLRPRLVSGEGVPLLNGDAKRD